MRLQFNFKQFYWFFHTLQFPKDHGMDLLLMTFEETTYMLKKHVRVQFIPSFAATGISRNELLDMASF